MSQTILYYPTIDIQDGTWLRNAVLYWDNISSIVPYENYPDFSPEVLYLQNCGIYKAIFPRDLFSSEYASDFTDAIIHRLEQYRSKSFLSTGHRRMRPSMQMHPNKICAPALYELLHYRKVPPALLDYLADNHLLKDCEHEGWLEVDERVASMYMRTLAEFTVKCCSEDIVIGTDRAKNQSGFYSRTSPRTNAACIALSLDSCLPQPSMEVGFEDLLDFKNRHQYEFAEFRSKLREFEQALSSCREIEEIKAQTEQFKEAWQGTLRKNEKLFTHERIRFALGTLSALISAPSVAEPFQNLLDKIPAVRNHSIIDAVLLGGTAAIRTGYRFVNYKNKVNEARSSAGFSYLLKASKAGIINSLSLSNIQF